MWHTNGNDKMTGEYQAMAIAREPMCFFLSNWKYMAVKRDRFRAKKQPVHLFMQEREI